MIRKNWRHTLVYLVLSVLLVCGLTGKTYFPFSDYPMYARLKPTPTIKTFSIELESGRTITAPRRIIWPLNRLHLDHIITVAYTKNIDRKKSFNWLIKKVRIAYPSARAIVIEDLTLSIPPSNNSTGDSHDSPQVATRVPAYIVDKRTTFERIEL